MCGICGIFGPAAGRATVREALGEMQAAIEHRGPDGSGQFVDPHGRVAFGHRRLAVIDLTEGGHQPMASRSGRFTIKYYA